MDGIKIRFIPEMRTWSKSSDHFRLKMAAGLRSLGFGIADHKFM